MRTFLIVLGLLIVQNSFSSSNEFASHYEKSSLEYKELSNMTTKESDKMRECINEALKDGLDHFGASESCINDVLGDIYN